MGALAICATLKLHCSLILAQIIIYAIFVGVNMLVHYALQPCQLFELSDHCRIWVEFVADFVENFVS